MPTSALEIFLAYKFVELLATPWPEWDAFKLGLIDKNGKTLKKSKTREEKAAMPMYNVLIRNIKRITDKLPFGQTKLGAFTTALVLLKECNITPDDVDSSFLAEHLEIELLNYDSSMDNLVTEGFHPSLLWQRCYVDNTSILDDLVECSGLVTVCSETKLSCEVVDAVTGERYSLPRSMLREY